MRNKKAKQIKKKLARKLYSDHSDNYKIKVKRSNTKSVYSTRQAIKEVYDDNEFKKLYRARKKNYLRQLVKD
jgi:hypothetical protein